jgi:cytochrome P450
MILGASGTTRDALANLLHLVLTDREVRHALMVDPEGRAANLVEESLRLRDSRTLTGLPRVALQDVEIGGQVVSTGDTVALLADLGSRDPRHYPRPDTVDLDRSSPKDHFAFGAGRRACVGANLGRTQVTRGLVELVTQLPDLMLDETRERPVRSGMGIGAGTSSYAPLHVGFGRRSVQ